MADRGRVGTEEGKGICAKRWGAKDRNNNNLVTLWYTSSMTWRKVEDNRVSSKELLVAGSKKRCRKICKGLQYVSEDGEQNRDTNRKVEVEWSFRKTIDTPNGELDYKVAVSSWKRCYPSGLQ